MQRPSQKEVSLQAFLRDYDSYARDVRGLSAATREIHDRTIRRFCAFRFRNGRIVWSAVRFTDVVSFLAAEFERLRNRDTQRVWLASLRSILRYLAEAGAVPVGWDMALPRTATRRHANLPRHLSREQVQALFAICRGKQPRALRDRAVLLLLLRLGLRTGEVENLTWEDIDWQEGTVRIHSPKTRRERVLPLPHDVGKALVAYLRTFDKCPALIFESVRTTTASGRRHIRIKDVVRSLFRRAGIVGRSAHSLRHTVATEMVNHGASFKDVADLLGHRWLSTTLIYAKLDMKSLRKVALPWPGGAR